jgi:hypothetical protein
MDKCIHQYKIITILFSKQRHLILLSHILLEIYQDQSIHFIDRLMMNLSKIIQVWMTIDTNHFAYHLMVQNRSFVCEFDQLMIELNIILRYMHGHIVMNFIYEISTCSNNNIGIWIYSFIIWDSFFFRFHTWLLDK